MIVCEMCRGVGGFHYEACRKRPAAPSDPPVETQQDGERAAGARALRAAAKAARGMHHPVGPDCEEWAAWLDARADGLSVPRLAARPSEWRVGNHYGIHVYEDGRPIATFHRAEDAVRAVAAVNECEPAGSVDRAQVAAAYRVAASYRQLADELRKDHGYSETANNFSAFVGDLTEALDKAGALRPLHLDAEDMRAGVLAVHKPTQVWTDSTINIDDLSGAMTETQDALYDDDGEVVYAPDVRTVCQGCDIRNNIPWPCLTARAVGVAE